jgi:hypothetical protein
MKTIDMSEQAVWQRLRQVDQLHELCLSLVKAGKAHREKVRPDPKNEQSKQKQDRKTRV